MQAWSSTTHWDAPSSLPTNPSSVASVNSLSGTSFLYAFCKTYSPGAAAIAGYLRLPGPLEAGRFGPLRLSDQSAHTSHQVPVCVSAFASHSSALAPGFGPNQ